MKYLNHLLLTDGDEPECYNETCRVEDNSMWELVMKDEIKSLILNQSWKLVKLLVGKKALLNECIELSRNVMVLRDIRLDW